MHELVSAISEMEEDKALRIVREMLDRGEEGTRVLALSQEAMGVVGHRFEVGDYFLPELIMSGEILKKISALVKPTLLPQTSNGHHQGKVVIGTVRGDVHDIGKDIVVFMLDVNGFEVRDLGVDVPEAQFVNAIHEFQPDVVALSGFLTVAFDTMKATIEAIAKAGLRDKVKIMIGGGQIDQRVCDYARADAHGYDAMTAVTLARQWTEGK